MILPRHPRRAHPRRSGAGSVARHSSAWRAAQFVLRSTGSQRGVAAINSPRFLRLLANVGHPRDPFHRIDVLASSRQLRLELDGQVRVSAGAAVRDHAPGPLLAARLRTSARNRRRAAPDVRRPQGPGVVLAGQGRRPGRPRHRLDLPGAAARRDAGPRPHGLLLRRANRRDRGRCTPRASHHTLVAGAARLAGPSRPGPAGGRRGGAGPAGG